VDHTTGVLFAGDLVFFNRAPTTPHASIGEWLSALQRLEETKYRILVPGHGEPVSDGRAIDQTRRYLRWVEETLQRGAERGVEMTELISQEIPSEFSGIPLAKSEFARSVAHLYRRYEATTLQRLR
jgi:glyoxylase-like metal-dependent hydrolase (beta-lactamase superfamily II)